MDKNKDEWFEEVCGSCRNETLVHNDYNSKFDNPSFICAKCEEGRAVILKRYEHDSEVE